MSGVVLGSEVPAFTPVAGLGTGPEAVPEVVPGFVPVPGSGAGPSVVPEVLDLELGVLRVSGPGELKSDKLKSEVLGGEPGVLRPSGLSGRGMSLAYSWSRVVSMCTSGGKTAGGTTDGAAPSEQPLGGCIV